MDSLVDDLADDLEDSIFAHVALDVDNTQASVSFQECSFSSTIDEENFRGPISQSTPRKPAAARETPVVPPTLVSKKSPKPRLPCPQCPKTFANENTLTVHVKMHVMAIVSKRIPKGEEIVELTRSSIIQSFKEIQEEGQRDAMAESLCALCCCVERIVATGEGECLIEFFSRCFTNVLKDLNVLLPSALRCTVLIRTNKLLCSLEFLSEVQNVLLNLGKEVNFKLLNSFVGHVCFKIFNWQFVFCLRIIRGQSIHEGTQVRQRFSSDMSHKEEFQQLVYHIGGSVIMGVLKKTKQYPDNAFWCEYAKVINDKFLFKSGSEPDDCLAHVKCFTQGRDRGGLKYLNSDAFNLFLALFDTIQCLEGSDGSLPLEVVEDKVYSHDIIMFMWDELVGTELSEEQSLHLFADIVRCCTKVTAKGVFKRRLNEYLTKAYSSVPLRPVLARN